MIAVGPIAIEGEQVSRGIDDTESAAVGGSSLQSHAWLVQKFVHQGFGEMFDRVRLFS